MGISTSFDESSLRSAFYKCQFRDIVASTNDGCTGTLRLNSSIIRSQAFGELMQFDMAQNCLEQNLRHIDAEQYQSYQYAFGRLHYLRDEFATAASYFGKLFDANCDDMEWRYRGALGFVAAQDSLGHCDFESNASKFLEENLHLQPDDLKISYYLLYGHLKNQSDRSVARRYFNEALNLSFRNSWSYFIGRSMYGLACHYQDQEPFHTKTILDLLNQIVQPAENPMLAYLINSKFTSFGTVVKSSIAIDRTYQSIRIDGKTISFRQKPVLFKFISYLIELQRTASKEEISQHIWSDEKYQQETHDPRIYTLATRIRQMIERSANQCIILISNEGGYLLAVQSDSQQ
jgi:tetratricopeptide (TPR) repeat protein